MSIHEILDRKALGNIREVLVGVVCLVAQVVVVQAFEGRSGVEAEVTRAHGVVQRRRLGPIASRKQAVQRQELKQQLRKRRQHVQDDISRTARADRLALLGELSAGRQALEGTTIALGLSTIRVLTNPVRRFAAPREPLTRYVPEHGSARRGAAAGPSGMTADHLRPLFHSECDSGVMAELGASLARGGSSGRLGGNPHGMDDSSEERRWWCLGIVVGDLSSEDLSCTIAQQIAK